ncbi:MAG: cohesin domain-containing protein, partial [Microgenomates group bacterium]
MRSLIKKILLFIIVFLFFGKIHSIEAATLKFDPTSINSNSGNNFDVKVVLDPGSDQVYSTDIYINYDSSLLKVVNVKPENLFPTVSHDESTAGKIYIAAMENDPTAYIASAGAVVTITFQGLKDGSGNLSFDCTNSKVIKNDANGTNVLVCSANDKATITIGTSNTQIPT